MNIIANYEELHSLPPLSQANRSREKVRYQAVSMHMAFGCLKKDECEKNLKREGCWSLSVEESNKTKKDLEELKKISAKAKEFVEALSSPNEVFVNDPCSESLFYVLGWKAIDEIRESMPLISIRKNYHLPRVLMQGARIQHDIERKMESLALLHGLEPLNSGAKGNDAIDPALLEVENQLECLHNAILEVQKIAAKMMLPSHLEMSEEVLDQQMRETLKLCTIENDAWQESIGGFEYLREGSSQLVVHSGEWSSRQEHLAEFIEVMETFMKESEANCLVLPKSATRQRLKLRNLMYKVVTDHYKAKVLLTELNSSTEEALEKKYPLNAFDKEIEKITLRPAPVHPHAALA